MRDNISLQDYNTTITLTGADGKRKKLWQENRLGRALRQAGCELRIPGVTGHSTYEMRSHNLITNVGHAAANAKITNQGSYGTFTDIAIGLGSETAAATDMALSYEITSGGGAQIGRAHV